jgi:hypothetical protein
MSKPRRSIRGIVIGIIAIIIAIAAISIINTAHAAVHSTHLTAKRHLVHEHVLAFSHALAHDTPNFA